MNMVFPDKVTAKLHLVVMTISAYYFAVNFKNILIFPWTTFGSFLLLGFVFFISNKKENNNLFLSLIISSLSLNFISIYQNTENTYTILTVWSYLTDFSLILFTISLGIYKLSKHKYSKFYSAIILSISLLPSLFAGFCYINNLPVFQQIPSFHPTSAILFFLISLKLFSNILNGDLFKIISKCDFTLTPSCGVLLFTIYNGFLFGSFELKGQPIGYSSLLLIVGASLYFLFAFIFTYLLILASKASVTQKPMLQMCAWSKMVKFNNKWLSIEEYLKQKEDIQITHGISPEVKDNLLKTKK